MVSVYITPHIAARWAFISCADRGIPLLVRWSRARPPHFVLVLRAGARDEYAFRDDLRNRFHGTVRRVA